MGRVTYTPLAIGTADSTAADAIFSAIQTQSTSLDAANFAEEGLDGRSFESAIQADRAFVAIVGDGTDTQALTTSWATVTATHFTSSFRTGGITVGTNERLRVVASLEFLSDATQTGIPTGGDVQCRWRQSVSASPSVIGTIRRIRPVLASYPTNVTLPTVTFDGRDARLRMQTVIDGPVTLDWVELQISDQSGTDVTVQLGSGSLRGMIYKRVTV